jgi:putative ABC transport system permease protein
VKRLLAALLLLYPPSHRRDYGEEMLAAARHRCSAAGNTLGIRAAVLIDVALGGVGVWGDRLGVGMTGMTRGWVLDARFVLRSLWRNRGYAATTVLVLSCSVAATATVFSFVRGTLLDRPPYPEPENVLVVWGSNVEDGQLRDVVSGPAYIELQRHATTFDAIAAFHHDAAYLITDGRPEVLDAIEASADFFRVLRVQPFMGRLFGEEDRTSGGPSAVVVTHAFWRDRLDSDREAVGRTLPFEGEARTLIGVLPEGFEFMAPAPLFVPLRDDVLAADEPSRIHYNVLARLSPGVTLADAASDVARAADRFADVYPFFEGWTFRAERLHDVAVESVRPALWTLTATVSLVMLVALVNLATLFRIRALARGSELAVRTALGAGWSRVARVLVLETGLLAVGGAALGLLATPFVVGRVAQIVPQWIAIPDSASRVPVLRGVLDPAVALAVFGAAVLGALLMTAPSLVSTVRSSGIRNTRGVHGGIRGARVLVGLEVAVATTLCVGAGLLVRSADKLLSVELGIVHEGLATLYYGDAWGLDPAERATYFRRTVEAVEAVPGVRRAGVIDYIDFQAEDDFARVYFLDRALQPTRDVREEWRRVDEGLFDAAGMEIVEGRGFTADDFVGSPRAVVVNSSFASKHWPQRSPVGALVSIHDPAYRELQVVGVVADVHSLGPASPPPPMLYAPLQGNSRGTVGMYVRVEGDPASYFTALREAIWSVDSSQPIAGVWPMSAFVETWVAVPMATRTLVAGLAGLTLFLSGVGIFGVVSYVVRTRRSELGVRLALGATPERLERDQMKVMLGVVALALGGGLGAGATAAWGARSMLYGVGPLDPVSIVAAIVAMGAAALLASYLPARRVGRIDPTESMRTE